MKNRLIKLSLTLLLILGLVGCEGAKQKSPEVSTTGNLSVYYFDVGQGDSILIRTNKGENVLIDGGNNDKGKQVVRYLQALHIDTLDAVIGTHPDADHIGGLDTVIDNMKVQAVYTPKVTHTTITYEDFVKAVKRKGLKLKEAKAGVSLGLSGADAVFVAPVKSYGDDLNAWSAVVKVTYGENSFLFTGDAPVKSEKDMIAAGQNIRSNVLKVGHHGANTSTSQAFLSAVQPEYAVISAGKGNKYGHPTAEIIKRLQANGIKIYRTDELGTILSTSDGKNIMFTKVPSLAPQ
ncbi:ComEC/Rec2 family competence protein [Aneurinibacillus uraniidurans]|uniref:ComEC/Rec2 family competence protein n=1 Tax=Aneurinibacillus uraniidurans TaxID=2966586 RepID=UPI00234A6767|nr:ComEC/Rec2 family competence protein [Aneurinibacillus sp. B1]WCN36328.1 ComEC/Rec2 family competence protein [Aneurinibacillus sp. B1]